MSARVNVRRHTSNESSNNAACGNLKQTVRHFVLNVRQQRRKARQRSSSVLQQRIDLRSIDDDDDGRR